MHSDRILGAHRLGRMLLGPGVVAAFAAFELHGYGPPTATAGGLTVFAVAQISIAVWGRWQLRRTSARLAKLRAKRRRRH